MYFTYVLECYQKERKVLYIGVTANLEKRFNEHLAGKTKTTNKFDKIRLIYYEACLCKKDAVRREKALKTGFGRSYLKRRLKNYLCKSPHSSTDRTQVS